MRGGGFRSAAAVAAALAVAALAAPSVMAADNLGLFAGNSVQRGTIEMLLVGKGQQQVTLSEGGTTISSHTITGVAGAPAQFLQLLDKATASCTNRERVFALDAAGETQVTSEVLTPNCRRRFTLDNLPRTATAGTQVTAQARDGFKLGASPELCIDPPNAAETCSPLVVPAAGGTGTRQQTLTAPGVWAFRLQTARQTLERTVAVDSVGPAAPAPLSNVVFYGDSIMAQIATALDDALPLHARVKNVLVGGGRLADFGVLFHDTPAMSWFQRAQIETTELNPRLSVVMLGGAESRDQNLYDPPELGGTGGMVKCCSAGWIRGYRLFVDLMRDAATARGGRLLWVLNPAASNTDREGVLDAVAAAVTTEIPAAQIVDLRQRFGAAYSDNVVINGSYTRVRAGDKIHLTIAGIRLAAGEIASALGAFPQSPSPDTTPACSGFGGQFTVGQPVTIGTCTDADGDNLSLGVENPGPSRGTTQVGQQNTNDPSLVYTPTQAGPDTIRLNATDGRGTSSTVEVAAVNVAAGSNDPPACVGSAPSPRLKPGQSAQIGSCSDPDAGDTLELSVTTAPTKGTISINGQNSASPKLRYTATAAGADSVQFKASDGEGGNSPLAIVAIQNDPAPVNQAPVCASTLVVTLVGTTRDFRCTDPEGQPLSYVVEKPPGRGTVTPIADGLRYRATAAGGDSFVFHAGDGTSSSAATTIASVNVAPGGPGPPMTPPADPPKKRACAGLSGKRAAKCKLDQKVKSRCGRLKGKKKTICGRRVRALDKCSKINQGTTRGVRKYKACVRKARAIGRPNPKRRAGRSSR